MYHLAIRGSGCSLDHLTSLDVGWTYRRMTPGVCCSSILCILHNSTEHTVSHVQLLQMVQRELQYVWPDKGQPLLAVCSVIVTHHM